MRATVLILVCASWISGCVSECEISKNNRYKKISSSVLVSKTSLWLYQPDNRSGRSRRGLYRLTNNGEEQEGLVQRIPTGQRFNVRKVMRVTSDGSSSDYFVGDLLLRGEPYTFWFHLGTSVYPDRWRQIYEVFDIQDPSSGAR